MNTPDDRKQDAIRKTARLPRRPSGQPWTPRQLIEYVFEHEDEVGSAFTAGTWMIVLLRYIDSDGRAKWIAYAGPEPDGYTPTADDLDLLLGLGQELGAPPPKPEEIVKDVRRLSPRFRLIWQWAE